MVIYDHNGDGDDYGNVDDETESYSRQRGARIVKASHFRFIIDIMAIGPSPDNNIIILREAIISK